MSRITLLLLGSALMLIVAACDSGGDGNGDEESNGDSTEMTSESDQDNGEEETTETEESGEAETEESDTSDDENGTGEEGSDDAEGTPEESGEGENGTGEEGSEDAEGTPDESAQNGDSGDEGEGDDAATTPDEEGTPGSEDEEALDPEEAQPGPDEGMFFDLDFEEANELTPFELVEPETVPEGVEFQSIMGLASPEASEEERSEEATTVTFSYAQPAGEDQMQGLPVEFTQTSEMDMTENLPPESEQEETTIGDREVTKVRIQAETQDEIIAYMWGDGEVYYSIAAILGPDLEEADLEEMVASVPSA